MPVGAYQPVKIDIRLISATQKNLREEVKNGTFREDLYFRLVIIAIKLPPLRKRIGDIELLAKNFLELQCAHHDRNIPGFYPDAMQAILHYKWPGNVRELENEIERLVLLCEPGEKIPFSLLSTHIRKVDQIHNNEDNIIFKNGICVMMMRFRILSDRLSSKPFYNLAMY